MLCADPLHGKVFPCPSCSYDGEEPDGAPVYGLYSETDAELMAPRAAQGARTATVWSVEEYAESPLAPAHFRLLASGHLLAWGPVENAPGIMLLVRLAGAAIKLLPSAELRAELAANAPPDDRPTIPIRTEQGLAAPRVAWERRRKIVVAGDWRPD